VLRSAFDGLPVLESEGAIFEAARRPRSLVTVSKGVRELWLSVAQGQDCAQYRAHAVAAWHALTAVPVQPLGVVRLYHAARGAAVARRAAEQLTGDAQDLAS
jgi:hypothetical protein